MLYSLQTTYLQILCPHHVPPTPPLPLCTHEPPHSSSTEYGLNEHQFSSSRLVEWTLSATAEKYYMQNIMPLGLASFVLEPNCLARWVWMSIIVHYSALCTSSTQDLLQARMVFHTYGSHLSSVSHQTWTNMCCNIFGWTPEGSRKGDAVVDLREASLVSWEGMVEL